MIARLSKQAKKARPITTKRDVVSLLKRRGVNFSAWGRDTTESLEQLLESLVSEEVALEDPDEAGYVILRAKLAVVKVKFTGRPGTRIDLYQTGQFFIKNRELITNNLEGVAAIMKRGEDPLSAARRALFHTLGQTQKGFKEAKNYQLISQPDLSRLGPEVSQKWPGTMVIFEKLIFTSYIGNGLYCPEYRQTHLQNDKPVKTTIFNWIES